MLGVGAFEDEGRCRSRLNKRLAEMSEELPLFDGTLEQAVAVAEQDNGLLLLLFLDGDNGDSRDFVAKVLASAAFVDYVKGVSFKNVSVLLHTVANSSHFQVARGLGIVRYPAVAIKTRLQDKFQTVLCFEGFLEAERLCGLVQSVLLATEAEIAQATELSATRTLQNAQDEAYRQSLAIDQERRRKREEEEVEERERGREKEKEQERRVHEEDDRNKLWMERMHRARAALAPEPEAGTVAFRFSFLLPDGSRHMRAFGPNATVGGLFDFVFATSVLSGDDVVIQSLQPTVRLCESQSAARLSDFYDVGKGVRLFVEVM